MFRLGSITFVIYTACFTNDNESDGIKNTIYLTFSELTRLFKKSKKIESLIATTL